MDEVLGQTSHEPFSPDLADQLTKQDQDIMTTREAKTYYDEATQIVGWTRVLQTLKIPTVITTAASLEPSESRGILLNKNCSKRNSEKARS